MDRPISVGYPDIALIEPAPPGVEALRSLKTWEEGHVPPRFAVEVVSATNPNKDYVRAPVKYAALGTRELVICDPELFGPEGMDEPHVLQVWRRREDYREMVRVYAGDGPAFSMELCGVLLDEVRRAHIASLDLAGLDQLRSHVKARRAWPE